MTAGRIFVIRVPGPGNMMRGAGYFRHGNPCGLSVAAGPGGVESIEAILASDGLIRYLFSVDNAKTSVDGFGKRPFWALTGVFPHDLRAKNMPL